jgi:hypothetical protein
MKHFALDDATHDDVDDSWTLEREREERTREIGEQLIDTRMPTSSSVPFCGWRKEKLSSFLRVSLSSSEGWLVRVHVDFSMRSIALHFKRKFLHFSTGNSHYSVGQPCSCTPTNWIDHIDRWRNVLFLLVLNVPAFLSILSSLLSISFIN